MTGLATLTTGSFAQWQCDPVDLLTTMAMSAAIGLGVGAAVGWALRRLV